MPEAAQREKKQLPLQELADVQRDEMMALGVCKGKDRLLLLVPSF